MIQQLASIADSKASMPLIKSIPLSSIQSIGQSLSPLNIHQQKLRVTLQQNYAPLRTPQRPHAQLHHSESLDKWETLLDDLEKKSIQSFLQETRIQLSHYFSSLNDAKNIHTAEFHPYFITKPIEYAHIKAAAEKAFTDKSYAKDHPRDGCYARAELTALHLDKEGKCVGKIFVTEAALVLQHPLFQNVAWNYHVAAVAVSKEDNQLWVIDPCISQEPILLPPWLEKFVVSDSVKLTFTHASYRYTPQNFVFNLKHPFERIEKAKGALNALAKTGCVQTDYQSDSDFGHYVQFSEDQQLNNQLLRATSLKQI